MRAIGLFFIICFFVFNSVGAGFYLLEEVTGIDVFSLLEFVSDELVGELIVLIVFFTLIESILLTLIAIGVLHRKETKDIVVVNSPATSANSVQEELTQLKIRELERQLEKMRKQQEHSRYMPRIEQEE
ncbi:MAG TPA: hypothetical protein H9818_06480 [Candidatus Phocaeicola gallistercoris]|nr:hypothetical protein [Candidatus Phocaeicola gallistercoris]